MKKLIALIGLASLLTFSAGTALAKKPPQTNALGLADCTVIVIRHAEKPADPANLGLSAQGQARALAYVAYFKSLTDKDGNSITPNVLMAAKDSKQSTRARLTIEPLSHATLVPIDSRFVNRHPDELADALRKEKHGNHVLISWDHGQIRRLIHELGGDPDDLIKGGDWPEDHFDWVVVLQYNHKGKVHRAQLLKPALMPGDDAK